VKDLDEADHVFVFSAPSTLDRGRDRTGQQSGPRVHEKLRPQRQRVGGVSPTGHIIPHMRFTRTKGTGIEYYALATDRGAFCQAEILDAGLFAFILNR